MAKGNTLMSIIGVFLLAGGLMSAPFSIALLLGATILNSFFPGQLIQFFVGFGAISLAIQAIMVFVGFKLFNENQTQFGRLAIGILGLLFIISGVLIAIAGIETIVASLIGVAMIVLGLALLDFGFKTKTVMPVSNVLMKIK